MKPVFGRSSVVLAAISVEICVAMALPIYGGSVANTYMAVALGWTRQTLGLMVAVNMVGNAAFAPVAAATVGRFGVRSSMLVGNLIMIAAGTALATVVTQPWHAVVAFSVMMGAAGALSGVIPCQTGVAAWFVRRRTMALSILYAAQGVGGFLAVHAINAVNAATGQWRDGWWLFAAAGVVGLVTAALLVRDTPPISEAEPEMMPARVAEESASASAGEGNLAEALRSPLLWAVCLTMLTLMAGSGFILAHSQVYFRGLGFTPTMAASTVSTMSIATVGGNIGFGMLAARLGLKRTYILALLAFAAGLALLANVHNEAGLAIYAIVAGIGFGAGQVGAMAILGHYWAARLFPALTATGLLVQTMGGGLVPIIAGAYFDAHQSYLPVIYALAALNVVAALILVAMGRQKLQLSAAARVG
ncbi:MAG: MFS transporter [Caulobacteraceae bacterium]|nr:MFS transporter [Caulobacteraceae bacterium]